MSQGVGLGAEVVHHVVEVEVEVEVEVKVTVKGVGLGVEAGALQQHSHLRRMTGRLGLQYAGPTTCSAATTDMSFSLARVWLERRRELIVATTTSRCQMAPRPPVANGRNALD